MLAKRVAELVLPPICSYAEVPRIPFTLIFPDLCLGGQKLSSHKELERPVSEEDDSYAKSSLHMYMSLGGKGQKVLGLAWDFEEDTISLDLPAIAKCAEGLIATKRNTFKLLL